MLLILTSYAVEVLYILLQIQVIMGNQDNRNLKSSKTSIPFTRSGGILNLPLLALLLNLEIYSWKDIMKGPSQLHHITNIISAMKNDDKRWNRYSKTVKATLFF